VILIVCEDAVTAPEYFFGLRECHERLRVEVEIHGGSGVPKSVVERAKELSTQAMAWSRSDQGDESAYDQVWCVFDRDEHPHVPDAFQMAEANGIQVAFANPCFELWLLLHFREPPGMKHRHEVARMVEEFVPDYEKSVDILQFINGYPDAVKRAKRLCATVDDLPLWDRNHTRTSTS